MKIALTAALLVLLAGCGSSKPETVVVTKTVTPTANAEATWRAEVEKGRGEPFSDARWTDYSTDVRKSICGSKDLVLTVGVGIDIPSPHPEFDRLAVKYACPERLEEWDQAVVTENSYIARAKVLCGPVKRLAEKVAVVASLGTPGELDDATIVSSVCD